MAKDPQKKTLKIGKLTKFLLQISADKKAWDAFKKDPDAAMKKAQLSRAQIAAIKSNDPRRVRVAVFKECGISPGKLLLVLFPKIFPIAIVIVDLDL